jgi:hypothetical protein
MRGTNQQRGDIWRKPAPFNGTPETTPREHVDAVPIAIRLQHESEPADALPLAIELRTRTRRIGHPY